MLYIKIHRNLILYTCISKNCPINFKKFNRAIQCRQCKSNKHTEYLNSDKSLGNFQKSKSLKRDKNAKMQPLDCINNKPYIPKRTRSTRG